MLGENDDIKVLAEISREDLNASKILYENKLFPQSIFYFQQSVEKITKFIGLSTGVIESVDLQKKIKHDPTKIYKAAIKKYQMQINSEESKNFEKDFQVIQNFIDTSPSNLATFAVLTEIKKTLEIQPELPFDINSIKSPEDLYKIYKKVMPNDPDLDKFKSMIKNQHFRKQLEKMIAKFTSDLPQYIQSVLILFMINCYISRHVSTVRYPDIKDMVNPSVVYNEENPIIDTLPIFQNILDMCITSIEGFKYF